MIRTMLATTGVAIALTAGTAYADCNAERERFEEQYSAFLAKQSDSKSELQPIVQTLRDAAAELQAQGNTDGCVAVITALTYIADDQSRKSEKSSRQAQDQQAQKAEQQDQQAQAESKQEQGQSGVDQNQQAEQEDEQASAQADQGQGQQTQQQGQRDETTAQQDTQATQSEKPAETAQSSEQQATTADGESAEVLVDEQTKAITDRTVSFTKLNMPIEAGRFLEHEVRNFNETALGEVAGVLVSTTGGLSHMLVEQGGFLGIGEKKIAIPVKKLRWDPKKEIFYVNLTEKQIEDAPGYEKDSNDWVAEINDRWYQNPSE